jgi:guanylate kinase
MKRLLIISGPSAVGKTTVAKDIIDRGVGFELSRSATTRAPRGDGHDQEYIYLSEAEFRKKINDGDMLEYTEYGGNIYGTPVSEIERIYGEGKIPLLVLDINGALSLKNNTHGLAPFITYITADMETLDKRLYERAERDGFSEKAMAAYETRKAQNRKDLKRVLSLPSVFDTMVENTTVSVCADQVIEGFNKD